MWTTRALVVMALAAGPSACLLAVSTSGLAGDPLDASTPEEVAADAGIDTADREDATDARDAFAPPDGSVVYGGNGHAYLVLVATSGIDWASARDLAKSMGGHLATIGDANENAFLLDLVKTHPEAIRTDGDGPWLGGYQAADASEPIGGWTWVDATPWIYASWASGQPDNTGGAENYLNWYGPNQIDFAWNDEALNGTELRVISLIVEFE